MLAQEVLPDTPASAAGILNGDIIQDFDGKPVKTARALVDLVTAQPAGVSTQVKVLRPLALKNEAKAIADSAAASDAGADAMVCYAFVQMNGLGVQKNQAEANRWYRKAAEAGSSDAMFNLANNLTNGLGVAKDIAEANRWYRKGAEAGNANAMFSLAVNLQAGNGITKDAAEANRWYRKAAEGGSTAAMHNLASNLSNGIGGERDDLAATQWYRKAAELGLTDSMVNLGWHYENGRGVAKDEAEAVRLYRQAAGKGNGIGMSLLAGCLRDGRGTGKDEAEALRWYRKAAEKGVGGAMSAISDAYDHGTMGCGEGSQAGGGMALQGHRGRRRVRARPSHAEPRLVQRRASPRVPAAAAGGRPLQGRYRRQFRRGDEKRCHGSSHQRRQQASGGDPNRDDLAGERASRLAATRPRQREGSRYAGMSQQV